MAWPVSLTSFATMRVPEDRKARRSPPLISAALCPNVCSTLPRNEQPFAPYMMKPVPPKSRTTHPSNATSVAPIIVTPWWRPVRKTIPSAR